MSQDKSEKTYMNDIAHISEEELNKMPGWKRRSIQRTKRSIARLLRGAEREKQRLANLIGQPIPATPSQTPPPLSTPPPAAVQKQKKSGRGCGGCRAARKAFKRAKSAKEMSMTKMDLEKRRKDIEDQISLTTIKIHEHRVYKGPCPDCVKNTLVRLEEQIIRLNEDKTEVDARIASFTKAK